MFRFIDIRDHIINLEDVLFRGTDKLDNALFYGLRYAFQVAHIISVINDAAGDMIKLECYGDIDTD